MFEERAGIEAGLVSSKSNENRKSVPNQSNKERKYFIQRDYTGFGELLGKLLHTTDVLISNMFCMLILKHWERHRCVVSTVATDALVLKHQAISIHNAD